MICIEIQEQGLFLFVIVEPQEDTNICMFDFREEVVQQNHRFLYYRVVAESTESLLRPILYRLCLEQPIDNEDDWHNLIREVENTVQMFLTFGVLQTWKVIPYVLLKTGGPNFNFSTRQEREADS